MLVSIERLACNRTISTEEKNKKFKRMLGERVELLGLKPYVEKEDEKYLDRMVSFSVNFDGPSSLEFTVVQMYLLYVRYITELYNKKPAKNGYILYMRQDYLIGDVIAPVVRDIEAVDYRELERYRFVDLNSKQVKSVKHFIETNISRPRYVIIDNKGLEKEAVAKNTKLGKLIEYYESKGVPVYAIPVDYTKRIDTRDVQGYKGLKMKPSIRGFIDNPGEYMQDGKVYLVEPHDLEIKEIDIKTIKDRKIRQNDIVPTREEAEELLKYHLLKTAKKLERMQEDIDVELGELQERVNKVTERKVELRLLEREVENKIQEIGRRNGK